MSDRYQQHFDARILIAPLVSSNSSYVYLSIKTYLKNNYI
jgi:hypothetical protein